MIEHVHGMLWYAVHVELAKLQGGTIAHAKAFAGVEQDL